MNNPVSGPRRPGIKTLGPDPQHFLRDWDSNLDLDFFFPVTDSSLPLSPGHLGDLDVDWNSWSLDSNVLNVLFKDLDLDTGKLFIFFFFTDLDLDLKPFRPDSTRLLEYFNMKR